MNRNDRKPTSEIKNPRINEPVQAHLSEAAIMQNELSYKSARVNELTNMLFDRLDQYMGEQYPSACTETEREGFSSGYFRSLRICSQPIDEAIERLEEILRRLTL